MLVTPLRDGMNLVAKEYVACRSDLGGALVLSEFTGAAAELRQAYLVNPHDLEGVRTRSRRHSISRSRRAGAGCARCGARCSPTTWTAGRVRFSTRWPRRIHRRAEWVVWLQATSANALRTTVRRPASSSF